MFFDDHSLFTPEWARQPVFHITVNLKKTLMFNSHPNGGDFL
jgi:hypothetical protein